MGLKVPAAMQEAMDTWLSETGKEMQTESDADDAACLRTKRSLRRDHAGEWAAFCSGDLLRTAPSLKVAGSLARRAKTKKVLLARSGRPRPWRLAG